IAGRSTRTRRRCRSRTRSARRMAPEAVFVTMRRGRATRGRGSSAVARAAWRHWDSMVNKSVYLGTGRRKSSVARVRLTPGSGKKVVNGRPLEEYFAREVLTLTANRPLVVTEMDGKVDVIARVDGGGIAGQAGAVSLGIARALKDYD